MNFLIAFWSTVARWLNNLRAHKLAEKAYGKAAAANLKAVNARIARD